MKKLKICFFVPFYPIIKGGAEYQAKIIASELKNMGHEIIFISGGTEKRTVKFIDDFKVFQLSPLPTVFEKSLLYKKFMGEVTQILDKEKPTIIYQRILNTFTYRLSKYASKTKTPFILHIADNYSVEFSGKKGMYKKFIFKDILKRNPYLICQTEYQYKKIEELGFKPQLIIPNMHPSISETELKKDTNRIVWIGNARPVKQLEVFLNLACDLVEKDYTFNVIGKIPENNYGEMLLKKISNCKNVIYHGSKTNEYINDFLKVSGLLVNTSVSEGFSNTFIQSWMCGTPVLALNSDPDNVMGTHKIGINCKGEYNKLSMNLEKILLADNYNQVCKQSRKIAIRNFSTHANMNKFQLLLENIINEKTA